MIVVNCGVHVAKQLLCFVKVSNSSASLIDGLLNEGKSKKTLIQQRVALMRIGEGSQN